MTKHQPTHDEIMDALRKVQKDFADHLSRDMWMYTRTGATRPSVKVPRMELKPEIPVDMFRPHIRHQYGISYERHYPYSLPSYAWPSIVEDIPISRNYLAIKAFLYALAILGGVSSGTMLLMELVR